MRSPAVCKLPSSSGLISTRAKAAPSVLNFVPVKKYPNFMRVPFGDGCGDIHRSPIGTLIPSK